MGTKLKSTDKGKNSFTGLVSWTCMMLAIYGLLWIGLGLFFIAFRPEDAHKFTIYLFFMGYLQDKLSNETILSIICMVGLAAAVIFLIFFYRAERKQFEYSISRLLSKVWVEIKLSFIILSLSVATYYQYAWIFVAVVLFIVYMLCLDIGYNRSFFRRNAVRFILDSINANKERSPYERLSRKRMSSTVLAILCILALATLVASFMVFLIEIGAFNSNVSAVAGVAAVVVSGLCGIIGALSWYYLSQKKDLNDLTQIMRQVEEMYNGNLSAVNHIPPSSNFYDFAMQLNMIRTGIQKAVEDGVRADMTKVELITNVSHDIKTPLTSIISYIELVKKEKSLPQHIVEYIDTIANKANRLSHIVQDVFEVSKAATGNLALQMETLDIGKLLQQTLAEMEMTIDGSGLHWRFDIPDYPMHIYADGQKLYRVFQNLIRNVVQYALEGSRVYLMLRKAEDRVIVSIRNISKVELDGSAAQYLTGRFVRGDKTRTSEGSGLGLSIAKSFTEACQGKFDLMTDGDIFLVTVCFQLQDIQKPEIQRTETFAQEGEKQYKGPKHED